MLKEFKVKNFRGFENISFDLSDANNYTFNQECIDNGIINTALIYGKNASGKTNLGHAIMDITQHLTDNSSNKKDLYKNYINGNSFENVVDYEYVFSFEGAIVKYNYSKSEPNKTVKEKLYINNELVFEYDKEKSDEFSLSLLGTENLKNDMSNSHISPLKYIKSNAILDETSQNNVFNKFIEFVNGMSFYRYFERQFEFVGKRERSSLEEFIFKNDLIDDFEKFLNDVNIKEKIIMKEIDGEPKLFFAYRNKNLAFIKNASSGTLAITLLYLWLKNIDNYSFIFIDEFDGLYHNELSEIVIKKLIKCKAQTIVTSHNTSIMSNEFIRPDCLFELQDGQIYPFSKGTSKELRKAHNIEKMYKSGAFYAEK